ncbi:MAG: thiamine-phosphate kinase, partial [Sphingopyxis sp.]
LSDCAPEDVAWKLVGVNLSDLAAKGAEPIGVLLGFMLSDTIFDMRFAGALGEALSHYETALLGGDTVSAPSDSQVPRAFGLTAIGRATHVPVPARSGARPGDTLWVTGNIGLAMLGHLGETGAAPSDEAARARYLRPVPRLSEGLSLAPIVTAMMDISDGLLLDAKRMAQASGVTIALDSAAVPLPDAIRNDADLRGQALVWGDDYELLFTLPNGTEPPATARRIGTMSERGAHPLLIDGTPPGPEQRLGWEHGADIG